MSETQLTYHTLSNGLRVVHLLVSGRVEYCGLTVNVGSRDETFKSQGLAHFIEHTIFKGTSIHPASYILNRMEEVGGELNAYTTKEETVIYSVFPLGHLSMAADLLGELVCHASFPNEEIEKERTVVLEEIDSYRDTPAENVFDLFDERLFKGSSLAHNILGKPSTIRNFTSGDCREFLTSHYTVENMVFFYMGSTPCSEVLSIAEKAFCGTPHSSHLRSRHTPRINTRFNETISCGSHQCHTIMGCRLPGIKSQLHNALALVGNYMGGPGLNSILNVALRESRGLVYSVEASTAFFSDCGMLTVYFGCDHEDFMQCRDLVISEFNNLATNGISTDRLNAIKRQYIGQAIVASDNREQTALALGRSMINFGHVRSFNEFCQEINALTVDDFAQAANLLSGNSLSILRMGE